MRFTKSRGALSAVAVASSLSGVLAATWTSGGESYNLTPEGYYHNMYHALISMAAYGDYNDLCPQQTFTQAGLMKNFPQSTRQPWVVYSTFGPTPSGCSGFTAIVPEMNKALIVFRGDWELEQNLTSDQVSWDFISPGLGAACPGCMMNKFAAQGYMECKAETNNFEAIVSQWQGTSLIFSITGHGLGGMHSQIASVDFNQQNIDYYSHAYGSPAVFNAAGAEFYNFHFDGEAGERGISNNDQYVNYFADNPNYTPAGTPFWYSSQQWNYTGGGPSWQICWNEAGQGNSTRCQPHQQGNSSPQEDHYYYFTNVGQCGVMAQNTYTADQFLGQQEAVVAAYSSSVSAASVASSASVAAYYASVSAASVASVAATHTTTPVLVASAYASGTYVTYSSVKSGAAVLAPLSLFFSLTVGTVIAFLRLMA